MPKNIDTNQVHLEQRTRDFVNAYNDLKEKGKIASNDELARLLGYKSESSITEILGGRQNIPPKKWEKFKQHFSTEFSATGETIVDFKKKLGEVDPNTTVIQVILNLSYSGRKNSDTMEKMAATNQVNTEIIAALVSSILPNSKLADQVTASLAGQHKDDDRPVEDFLNLVQQNTAAGQKSGTGASGKVKAKNK